MALFFHLQILQGKKGISCLAKASAVCLGLLVVVAWTPEAGYLFQKDVYIAHSSQD